MFIDQVKVEVKTTIFIKELKNKNISAIRKVFPINITNIIFYIISDCE